MDMAVAILIRFAMLFYIGIIPQIHCHKLPDKRIPVNSTIKIFILFIFWIPFTLYPFYSIIEI